MIFEKTVNDNAGNKKFHVKFGLRKDFSVEPPSSG